MLSQKSRGCGIQMKALEGVVVIREGFLEKVSLKLNPKGQTGLVRQREKGQRCRDKTKLVQRTLSNKMGAQNGSWTSERRARVDPEGSLCHAKWFGVSPTSGGNYHF